MPDHVSGQTCWSDGRRGTLPKTLVRKRKVSIITSGLWAKGEKHIPARRAATQGLLYHLHEKSTPRL